MTEFEQNLLLMLPELISGAEEEGSDTDPVGDTQGDLAVNEGEDNQGDSEDEIPSNDPDEDGRTKALRAERKIRKDAEREAARLKAENDALKRASMDEHDRTKAERDDAITKITENETKLQKMITGFRENALKSAVSAEATKLGFIDLEDALNGVDTESIDIEQDEDDPSKVTIDAKTVTSAVKKLATAKPHFIKTGTSDGEPTGSQFGGSRKGKKSDDEDTLRMRYPSL